MGTQNQTTIMWWLLCGFLSLWSEFFIRLPPLNLIPFPLLFLHSSPPSKLLRLFPSLSRYFFFSLCDSQISLSGSDEGDCWFRRSQDQAQASNPYAGISGVARGNWDFWVPNLFRFPLDLMIWYDSIWVLLCSVMNLGFGNCSFDCQKKKKSFKLYCFLFSSSQETEYKMRKLEMMKQKRLTLDAEVRYNLSSSCKIQPVIGLFGTLHWLAFWLFWSKR